METIIVGGRNRRNEREKEGGWNKQTSYITVTEGKCQKPQKLGIVMAVTSQDRTHPYTGKRIALKIECRDGVTCEDIWSLSSLYIFSVALALPSVYIPLHFWQMFFILVCTLFPCTIVQHRRRKQGGRGGICRHRNYLVGALPPRKSARVDDGYVNLTQQLSPYSMEQCGTIALVGFKAIV